MNKSEKKIGFTCGAFDLTHAGHYLMFKDCKRVCDYLIVGLQMDPSKDRRDKNKPIQSLDERLIQLQACKYIDQIIIYDTEKDLMNLLQVKQIDIRILGEDWKDKRFTGDELDIPVVFTSRDHLYSSTSLRERIYNAEHTKRA